MTITVYWTCLKNGQNAPYEFSLNAHDPIPIVKTFDKETLQSNYIRCPAVKEKLKNVYALKCNWGNTLQYDFNNKSLNTVEYDQMYYNSTVEADEIDYGILKLNTNYAFFADKPLILRQNHPWGSRNNISKVGNILGGQFDIHKWFRTINVTLLPHYRTSEFEIKNGDVLSYIEFMTDEKVVLKKFETSERIEEISQLCLKLKFGKSKVTKVFSLQYGYDKFLRNKLNKKLLEEIKKNLID